LCVAQIHEQTASFQSTAHSFGAVLYCRIAFMQIVRKESPNNFPLNHSLWHPWNHMLYYLSLWIEKIQRKENLYEIQSWLLYSAFIGTFLRRQIALYYYVLEFAIVETDQIPCILSVYDQYELQYSRRTTLKYYRILSKYSPCSTVERISIYFLWMNEWMNYSAYRLMSASIDTIVYIYITITTNTKYSISYIYIY